MKINKNPIKSPLKIKKKVWNKNNFKCNKLILK